ncbi:MAG: ABC transporter permease, partial [Gemmatimonadetes bacterium]
MGDVFNADLVAAAIRMATPLILVALAAAISLKAGIFNIAVEGVMLWAAFVAVVVATASGSVLLAVLASCVACVL